MMIRPGNVPVSATVAKAFSNVFFEHDGSLGGEAVFLTGNDARALRLACHLATDEAIKRELMEMVVAISRHGEIELFFPSPTSGGKVINIGLDRPDTS